MAAFKVGDKARLVWQSVESVSKFGDRTGMTGKIVAIPGSDPDRPACDFQPDDGGKTWRIKYFSSLAPLTDPGAESFIARIKKLGSEPVNDAPKVTVREGK